MADLPLAGVKVVELSRVLAGPLAAMVLADLGAEVVKVEHPERGDDTRDWGIRIGRTETTYYNAFNRNKKSVTLDLGSPEGQAVARELIADADIVIENFRQGGMEKFGLGYDSLKALNPRLVYCAIAGYDRAGAEAARPGYDLVVQGESGLMSINGEPGRPPLKFGVAVVDMFTGMYAAQAVLAALFQARATGEGRRIDLALYDCGLMISAYYGLDALTQKADPPRLGNEHPSVVPYGVFDAADGPLVVAIGNTRQFRSVAADVLGRADLADDPRFATNILRSQHRLDLMPILKAEIGRRARADLLAGLAAAGVPCGEVLGLHGALTSARSRAAGLIYSYDHPEAGPVAMMVPPWRFDGQRLPAAPPPRLGEHTAEVLAGLRGEGEE